MTARNVSNFINMLLLNIVIILYYKFDNGILYTFLLIVSQNACETLQIIYGL